MVLPGSSLEDIWEHRLEFESLEDFQSSVSMLPHPHLGTRGAGKAQGVEAFSAICRLSVPPSWKAGLSEWNGESPG